MAPTVSRPLDRVAERRRAAALARHYRDGEQLSDRRDRPPPRPRPRDGQGLPLRPHRREGPRRQGPLPRLLPHLRRRHQPAQRQGRRLPLLPALPTRRRRAASGRASACARRCAGWAELYGRAPSSYDWSRTHARRRGAQALRRLERGEWPAPATVSGLYGTWAARPGRRLRGSGGSRAADPATAGAGQYAR